MSRRNRAPQRPVPADKRYNSIPVTMMINRMMYGGKRSIAQQIMYSALNLAEEKAKRAGLEVLELALRNAAPTVEVKPRRVGGSTYQVPIDVDAERGRALAMRWLIQSARTRGGRNMEEKLAAELLDAANNQGAAVKKKEETHRMAEANRAFAHFR
jgi:small subunit ribosomal protein S7